MVEIYRDVQGTHVNSAMRSTAPDTATAPNTATISTLTAQIAQIKSDSEGQVRTLTAQIAQTRKEQEDRKDL